MFGIPEGKKLVLFDGVCNLCNSFVNKIIKKDKSNRFVFAAISSETGKKVTDYLNIDTEKMESIILYEPGVSYDFKSTAALKIIKDFGGIYFLTQLGYVLPEFVRDGIYDVVAKNRYEWFGKKESCMIPTPDLKSKFL